MPEVKINRIILAKPPGGPEVLGVHTRPMPAQSTGGIVIKNIACGVNRPDQIERMGFYPAPAGAPEGLGLEVSGHVFSVGEGVTEWSVGDPVCALVAGGGYSDYVGVDQGLVLPCPIGVDLKDAAGLPETVFTVWVNVFEGGKLLPNETMLVHGGTSGIGVMAIQMAKAAGAKVIATAGSDEKCQLCLGLGADHAINYKSQDYEMEIKALGGVDVILDMVGGTYVQKNINIMKTGGRMISIAFMQGSRVEIDLMRVMLKRLTLTGSTLRARPIEEKARIARAVRKTVWPWIEEGRIRPVIDTRYDLADVIAAHERLDAGGHSGKLILIP
jgi:NADPH2:quinone reductase